jgi:RNA-directed DNA polymerase
MTTGSSVGAVSGVDVDWHAVDWHKVHRNVRRLQARIVKAVKDGRWGKVQALQHLLTRSFSGKALAVRRVTENHGKRTPGVDGEVWETADTKAAAVRSIRQRGYRSRPLRRIYIAKRNGRGRRPLSIPSMTDRAMQALYLLALDPVAETTADPNSYGFRPERSPADAIDQVHRLLSRRDAAVWVLEGDIRACFDRISQSWLEGHIPMEKSILRAWLRAGFIEDGTLHPTEEGVPQGGIASPVMTNLVLDGLERMLKQMFPTGRHGNSPRVNVVRFADDFLVTGRTRELLEGEVTPAVEQFLKERGLELSAEKTRITHVSEGFDFLGQHVRKYANGRLFIKPTKTSVKALLDKVRGIVKANKQATTGSLIGMLNPVIRGWATYHRHVVSKATFSKVDAAIFRCLWRWARRRHPKKSARWVKERYFLSEGGRNWVFFGVTEGSDGTPKVMRLYYAAQTPVTRHVKIRGEANPYDPDWETYFEQRLGVKMAQDLRGRRRLLHLWKEQEGGCSVCGQKITRLTGWHAHHVVGRSQGGSDGMANRVLLHPECHRQVHSRGVPVSKPRPATGVGKA